MTLPSHAKGFLGNYIADRSCPCPRIPPARVPRGGLSSRKDKDLGGCVLHLRVCYTPPLSGI